MSSCVFRRCTNYTPKVKDKNVLFHATHETNDPFLCGHCSDRTCPECCLSSRPGAEQPHLKRTSTPKAMHLRGKEAPTGPERNRPPESAVKNINTQTGNLLKDPWGSLCYIRHVVITEKTQISAIYPFPNTLRDSFPYDSGYEKTDLMNSQWNLYYYFGLLLIKTFGVSLWAPI